MITQKNQLWHLALQEVELQNKRKAPEPLTNSNWNDHREMTDKREEEDPRDDGVTGTRSKRRSK